MDINDLRVVISVASFVVFIGIVIWAYSRKRARDFDEAAMLPFTGKEFGEDGVAGRESGEKR
jgi:cytochrome c oxidase cbb3-type subunit IV